MITTDSERMLHLAPDGGRLRDGQRLAYAVVVAVARCREVTEV
jgi:hypothetical protein